MLDLSVFLEVAPESAPERSESKSESPPEEQRGGEPDPLASYDLVAHEKLLSAMESAQKLQIDHPGNGGVAGILDSVLGMVGPFLGEATLYLELHTSPDPLEDQQRIFEAQSRGRPFWASSRVQGEAIWITDWSELPDYLKKRTIPRAEVTPADTRRPFACGAVVPLFSPADEDEADAGRGAEVGLLYLLSPREVGRDQLMRLGFRLSRFVLHCWRQRRMMSHLVHTDNLTGVRNRAFFDEQFSLEIERARRNESPLVLLLGDIDHFKLVNDRYGHQVGDRVLQTVAREMLHGLRRIDMVCRVGGEEFALVLPETGLEAAMEVINRIQVRIGNLRLSDPSSPEPIRVTISFGGVPFPEGGTEPAELYRHADQMLYLSKERGRNRCHFWNPEGEPLLTLPGYHSS